MDNYRHYVRPSTDGIIRYGFCDVQEAPQQGDILIDDNAPRQFNMQLQNDKGQYLYKVVNGQMVEKTADELFDLASYKQAKIASLSAICRSMILSDFTSSCMGTIKTFGFDSDNQLNFSGKGAAIGLGICPATFDWRSREDGKFTITIDQFKVLYADGVAHKESNLFKFQALMDQINLPATDSQAKVDVINW